MSPNDLKRLTEEGLRELAKDAYTRIGMYWREYLSEDYIEKQKGIIAMISEELTRRDV